MGTEIKQHRAYTFAKETYPKVKYPAQFQVIMLNDDYTPMDFVVIVLQTFFNMNLDMAVRTMLKVHQLGYAVCGVFHKDIAETKVAIVNNYATQHEHPLLCKMEKI